MLDAEPYFKTRLGRLYCGDALEVLKKLPSECVDVVITSPPYWAKRDYGEATCKVWGGDPNCDHEWVFDTVELNLQSRNENFQRSWREKASGEVVRAFCKKCGAWYGQLGMEPTPQMFVDHLVEIFREVKRVLKPTGSLFVVIDDTWSQRGKGIGTIDPKYPSGRNTANTVLPARSKSFDVPQKSLCLVPELFAIKMVYEEGWILREKIIWCKKVHFYKDRRTYGNAMPESVKDRFSHTWEYIFHFTKSPRYYFNLDAVRVPLKAETIERAKYGWNLDVKSKSDKYPRSTKVINLELAQKIRSKYLSEGVQNTRSPGGRLAKIIAEGKINQVTLVREAICNVNAYLKQKLKESGLTVKKLSEITGIKETQLAHYFRTDLSGSALPPREVWDILKPILNLGDYDDYIKEEYKSVLPSPYPLGANPGDVVQINLKPFKDAHFAVFPPSIPELLIKASCPRYVCPKCGKPFKVIKEYIETTKGIDFKYYGASESGEYHGKPLKEYKKSGAEDPSEVKKRILQSMKRALKSVRYEPDCRCGLEGVPGVVLDPFAGAGTTLIVAEKLGMRWIGIEINPEYCEIIKRRFEKELGGLIYSNRLF